MVLSSFVGSGIIKVHSVRLLSLYSVLTKSDTDKSCKIIVPLSFYVFLKKKKVICEIRKIL